MTTVTAARDLFDMTGEVALVTGASSGLGWRFAQVLAAHGAKVAIAARRMERLEALKNEIEAAGGEAFPVRMEAADVDSIHAAFDAAEKAFGTVTCLINNAGLSGNKWALEMTPDDWRKVISVNLDGAFYCAQEAARRMVAAKCPGRIVNIASVLGLQAAKTVTAYMASKGGVIQMTKGLAVELARHNIRVNAMAPGYVVTEMNRDFFETEQGEAFMKLIPQRRVADTSELDGLLLLLAAPKAATYMTGSTVVVDGGQSIALDR